MAIDVQACYRRYGPMVLRRCSFLLRDEEKAVDAMHDVFMQLLDQPVQPRMGPERLSSYLYCSATNLCLNRLRGERRNPSDSADELVLKIAAMGDLEERVGATNILERLFGTSPASTLTIALLHFVDGLTLEETAKAVGLSVSGTRYRLRALKAQLGELQEH